MYVDVDCIKSGFLWEIFEGEWENFEGMEYDVISVCFDKDDKFVYVNIDDSIERLLYEFVEFDDNWSLNESIFKIYLFFI